MPLEPNVHSTLLCYTFRVVDTHACKNTLGKVRDKIEEVFNRRRGVKEGLEKEEVDTIVTTASKCITLYTGLRRPQSDQ